MQPPLLERVFFRDQHAEGLVIAGPATAARLNYRNLLLADNDDDRLLQSNHKHLPSIVWSGQVCPAMVDSKLIEGNYQPLLSTPPYRNICGPTKTYGRVNGSFEYQFGGGWSQNEVALGQNEIRFSLSVPNGD